MTGKSQRGRRAEYSAADMLRDARKARGWTGSGMDACLCSWIVGLSSCRAGWLTVYGHEDRRSPGSGWAEVRSRIASFEVGSDNRRRLADGSARLPHQITVEICTVTERRCREDEDRARVVVGTSWRQTAPKFRPYRETLSVS